MKSPQQETYNIPERQMFKTVFFYCVLIIVAPVASFFVSKYCLFDVLMGESVASNVWSALTSVAVLHAALALFIYRAYAEVSTAKQPAKQD
ncbi:vacuolar ATPase assembly integral membrane protein VMA21 homolog [Neocloeon triangulifer]|uniref:vacuolar ATPase assembly integral membrane protein VMA21 homolog n=1 Tax=Neocloeon triangulifer TaxID=2078957 RepID=UPI00286F719D|nr:vacuolar ATPase assembly integral membrane protein VMA21 homolog [Neocloeon triangulifer]